MTKTHSNKNKPRTKSSIGKLRSRTKRMKPKNVNSQTSVKELWQTILNDKKRKKVLRDSWKAKSMKTYYENHIKSLS